MQSRLNPLVRATLAFGAAAALVLAAPDQARAHTVHVWHGTVTGEQHIDRTDGDGTRHTYDTSLRFDSATDLSQTALTTLTYSVHYVDFTPGSATGCSRTDETVGTGTVHGHVVFTTGNSASAYTVQTSGDEPVSYTTTITFAGPAVCADVLTSTGGSFLGTQLIFYTANPPVGLDPVHLEGSTTVDNQQGLTGPITWSWTVDVDNQPPVAVDDVASTAAGTGVDIDVLANDSDPDGDAIDLVSVTDPVNGTALIERGANVTIRYVPDDGFVGDDVFGYDVRDAHGATDTGSVRVSVTGPPVPPVPPVPPTADRTPPDTTIVSAPRHRTKRHRVRFTFTSTEPASRFQCRLDRSHWQTCTSPRRYSKLSFGRHVFRVRAVDASNNIDPTPARYRFRVVRRPS